MAQNLLIIGKGYAVEAILDRARRGGWAARITSRSAGGDDVVAFDDPALLEGVTHLVVTAPPGPAGDPVWAAHAAALRAAPLRWVGYIS
ncbi:MAG: SDR family NAD(P)-dependent oxidoreductase, partial [Roseococcus sp.]